METTPRQPSHRPFRGAAAATLLGALFLLAAGCEAAEVEGARSMEAGAPAGPCGPRYAAPVDWVSSRRGPITLRISSSVSPTEREAHLAARLLAYHRVGEVLGLTELPPVIVRLSPSRAAARAAGLATGVARPRLGTVEAVLPPGREVFERQRPGHLLALYLLAREDRPYRSVLLEQGLPEAIDGPSERVHRRLLGTVGGDRVRAALDLEAARPRAAGSFLRFLVDRHGWEGVTSLFANEAGLDVALLEATGEDLTATRRAWRRVLEGIEPGPPAPDRGAIEALVTAMDLAEQQGDATAFLGGMDDFYCDLWDGEHRRQLARARVARGGEIVSRVVAMRARGLRNYPEVEVELERLEDGHRHPVRVWVEHFPEGWRMTWSTAWPRPRLQPSRLPLGLAARW